MSINRNYGDVVFLKLAGSKEGGANVNCHSNRTWHYVLRVDDPIGEKMFSLLLSAEARGKEIARMTGDGTCQSSSGVEYLLQIRVN